MAAATNIHQRAYASCAAAFRVVLKEEPTQCEVAVLAGIAWLETQYGQGWRYEGAGSNNMGAITAGRDWTGDTFSYEDSRFDEATGQVVKYTTKFRVYPTAEEGWQDLVRAVFQWSGRAKVRDAARGCNFAAVSQGLYDSKYYLGTASTAEARVATHLKALVGAITTAGIMPTIPGFSPPPQPAAAPPTSKASVSIAPLAIMGVVGAIFYFTTRGPKRTKV